MKNWVEEICSDPDNFGIVLDAYEYYCKEYDVLRVEIDRDKIRGSRIQDISVKMPGLADIVQARWSEIKAISDHLDLLVLVATQKARRHFAEHYNRQLSVNQINDYAEADADVISLRQIQLRIVLVQNKWEGLSKGLERLHFQLRNIIELHKAGFEDIRI